MINLLVDFMICIFEVYIFYDFMHDILEKRFENRYAESVILVGMSAILLFINQFDISRLNLIASPVVFLVGTLILFCGRWKTRISYYLNYWFVMFGMEFIAGILFMAISGADFLTEEKNPFHNFFLIIITKLLSFVVLRLEKLFMKRQNVGMRGKLLKMTFLLPVTTIFLYAGLFYADIQIEKGKIALSVGCILLLLSNMLVFYIIEKLAYVMEQNHEYGLIQLQNELNQTYYGKLEEVGGRHRKYVHDLKEYMQTIGALALRSRNREIVEILKDMEIEIDSISDKIYTSHSVLNALLCEKEQQAHERKVAFEVMVEPGICLEKIKNGDLITMVGNLVDNAIEAASLCEGQKRVDLQFFESDGNFIVLNIENTYGNKIKRKGEVFFSTKTNARHHGIGIKSVRETAEKYGGLLFLEQKADVFVSILTLSKSERNQD